MLLAHTFIKECPSFPDWHFLSHPHGWHLVNMRLRQLVCSISYREVSIGVAPEHWSADPHRGCVYTSLHPGWLERTEIDSNKVLWKAKKGVCRCAPIVNPRSGNLLLADHFTRWINGESGQTEESCWVDHKSNLAAIHPAIPVTVFARMGESDMSVAPWKRKTTYHFSFLREDSGKVDEFCLQLKDAPSRMHFVGDLLLVRDYCGDVHAMNMNTGALQWSLSLHEKWFGMTDVSFNQRLGCLVLKVNQALLLVDPASGQELGHRVRPDSWGGYHGNLDCLVENGTRLLLMDGRLFDVETMDCVEEGVLADMGLLIGPWG